MIVFLFEAWLVDTKFNYANFSGADLTGAYLMEAELTNANLRGTILAGADLSGTDLRGIITDDKTDFTGAKYTAETRGLTTEQKNVMQFIAAPSFSFFSAAYAREFAEPIPITQTTDYSLKTFIVSDAKIIHLPQWHFFQNQSDRIKNTSALSQFQIMQTLLYNKDLGQKFIVFNEEAQKDYTQQSIKDDIKRPSYVKREMMNLSELIRQAKALFPSIPQYFEELEIEQRNFLYENGAANLLYYLGKIDTIYKSISESDYDRIFKEVDRSLPPDHEFNRYWVVNFKEEKLEEEIMKILDNNPEHKGKTVYVIYGKKHILDKNSPKTFAGQSFKRALTPLSSANFHWFVDKDQL